MEEDKIEIIFRNFRPELSSGEEFISRLQEKMERVEIVKAYTEALRRKSRTAVIVAGVSGFVMGVAMTIIYPLVSRWISVLMLSATELEVATVDTAIETLGWLLMGLSGALTAIRTYDFVLSRLVPKPISIGLLTDCRKFNG